MGASSIANTFFIAKNPSEALNAMDRKWIIFFLVSFGLTANVYQALHHSDYFIYLHPQSDVMSDPTRSSPIDLDSKKYVSILGYMISGLCTGFGTKVCCRPSMIMLKSNQYLLRHHLSSSLTHDKLMLFAFPKHISSQMDVLQVWVYSSSFILES
jgi:hypothetical protein